MVDLYFLRKVFQQGNSMAITIPLEIVNTMELKEGDEVKIVFIDGQMIVKR